MESDLDLDVEINSDVKDPEKSEIFGVTNHLNNPGEEKLSNFNSVPRSDFVAKYAHLEEFFKLESSKPRENGIFDMEFSFLNNETFSVLLMLLFIIFSKLTDLPISR